MIVLDEPTAGVDVELRQTLEVHPRLNREGHTHRFDHALPRRSANLCNRVAMLKAGKIVAS